MPKPKTAKSSVDSNAAISRRLREHYEVGGFPTIRAFQQGLGAAYSTVHGWLDDDPRIPETQHLISLSRVHGVNLDWLLLGEGDRLRTGESDEGTFNQQLRAQVISQLEATNTRNVARLADIVVPRGEVLIRELVALYVSKLEAGGKVLRAIKPALKAQSR